jgi:hypothetical protein
MNENSKSTLNKPLFFSTRSYPTFGRQRKPFDETSPPSTVTSSPYYWWFMFLRLNEGYTKACLSTRKGNFEDLFNDFGDVHALNFKLWWQSHAFLFAEPNKGYRMSIAKSVDEIAPFNSDDVLNLVVPLTWSQRSLKKAFSQLVLSKVEKGKRGVSVEQSDARYKLSGKWHIEALTNAHRIYSILKENEASGIKMTWADIAIKAKIPMSYALKDGHKQFNSDVRKTLTILAKRHYARAEKYINNAATNYFP